MSNQPNSSHARALRRPVSTVRLLSVAPDLADFLTPEERAQVDRVVVPTVMVSGHVAVSDVLADNHAFAALVADGMLLRQMRIGQSPSLRLFGPGELVASGSAPNSALLTESDCRAAEVTHLAMLGIEFLAAAHRWPRLVAALHARAADGAERVATQLAISQLPRVQDRILSMLWLLAESWGRVTASGTSLALSLTHETLGALIGARRPTVTLAIRELTERGALVHSSDGWLLLEAPPQPEGDDRQVEAPEVLGRRGSPWSAEPRPRAPDEHAQDILRETLSRLREDHRRNTEQHLAIVRDIIFTREQTADVRRRIRSRRLPTSEV